MVLQENAPVLKTEEAITQHTKDPTKDTALSSSKSSSDMILQTIQCTENNWELLLDCLCCSQAEPVLDDASTKLIADYIETKEYLNLIQVGGDDDDNASCGSISTKGSMCSSTHSGGHRGPLSIMRTSSLLLQRPSILKRQDSQHSGKSARFNEMMNETVEYSLDFLDQQDDNHDDDGDDDINSLGANTTRSAGGQAKYLTPNKSMDLRNDQRFDASVVGTSSKDDSVHPRIMNLDLMDAFQNHLPYTKRGQLFWLKYSMVRDGASMHTLLQKTEASQYNIIAIETMEGEVFGAFTSQAWNISVNFYGTAESFLWRLEGLRGATTTQSSDSSCSNKETMEVFPFAGNNWNIQLCTADSLSVGGGHPDETTSVKDYDGDNVNGDIKMSEWGFGITIGEDMQKGTSSPCITFESPSLSKFHKDGSSFEISNIEVWSLTPCNSLKQATKLEQTKQLIQRCRTF
ncbi:unnamed protein product [Cylindrotheca closterium]|uniref:Oxidation resistance protein 1 n=1 Tax=Cylindrotheca closterium TaxID=2856 RepID=A0AAD2G8E5_9STRA|nr:unnamed protein product [Cylindrotheca closterium]